MKKPTNINEYIADYPPKVQKLLKQVRATINKAAPEGIETISYGMPAVKYNGLLVWYAAHTSHIGFYPKASGIEAFKKELNEYTYAKGSVQFPYSKPLPLALITKIIKFRVAENVNKTVKKKKKIL